jgi:N-acetyl-1-D-myo-inositol-2-amino-2-deoxy-alpha-D-glucopyranoside deacetylase/mycothiol S-conjugate amidase
MPISTDRCLLFVGAHPDDESFGSGGTLAKYALAGARVYYACATRGEVGEASEEHLAGHASPGDMRWSELTCAAEALHLTGVIHLGYRDSGMPGSPHNTAAGALASAPLEEVTERVVKVIRDLRPQVIFTFDPIGGYRHPDHIAIHNATVKAFQAAGDPAQFPEAGPAYQPQKLYYDYFSRTMLRAAVRLMPLFGRDPRRFGTNHDVDLVSLIDVDYPVHARIRIPPEAARAKSAAAACHRSQLEGMPQDRGVLGPIMRFLQREEAFTRAQPAVPDGQPLRETDLFEGLV